jgi:hypothetical protein
MKKLLIKIWFNDPSDKFWWESGYDKEIINFDPDKETIHDVVKRLCEDVGMELSYNGKPQDNIYQDDKNGNPRICGYCYRGKGEVHDRNMIKPKMVYWDVYLSVVKEIVEFELEEI